MICYKDQTFCTASGCNNTSCASRLTQEIEQGAEKHDLPLSLTDASSYCLGFMTHKTTNSFGDTVIMGGERVIGVIPNE